MALHPSPHPPQRHHRSVRFDERQAYEVAPIEVPWVDPNNLMTRLKAKFAAPSYAPPALPSVATELLELSHRPDIEIEDVVRVLEKDSVLAGHALERANSAAYASSSVTRSLRHAIVRLGLNAVRNLVLEMAMHMKIFRSTVFAPAMETLRLHASAVALCCRLVARYTSFDPEFAFLCGLLHDVGWPAALIVLSDDAETFNDVSFNLAWAAIEPVHGEFSAAVVKAWKIGPEVELVVADHHCLTYEKVVHPYRAVIAIAEQIAEENGFEQPPHDTVAPGSMETLRAPVADVARQAAQALGLTNRQLTLTRDEAQRILGHP